MLESLLSKEKALQIMKQYNDLLMEYQHLGISGVYLVGSLADGNYLPGKSDLDVSVIVKNTCNIEEIESISSRIINLLKEKYAISIDFEAFIKKEEMLYPPYIPEKRKTIELMRIKRQAKKLGGCFEENDIPIPETKYFIADEIFSEHKLSQKMGKNMFDDMTEKQLFNYVVDFMRLYNIVYKDICVFNKKEIIATYYGSEDKSKEEEAIMQEILEKKDKSAYKKFLLDIAKVCKDKKQIMFNEQNKNDFDEMNV